MSGRLSGAKKRAFKARLMEAQGGCCCYCGREMTTVTTEMWRVPQNYATFEHKVPRSRGGSSGPSNLMLACRWCNSRRGDGPPPKLAQAEGSK